MHLIIRDKDEVILASGPVQTEDVTKPRAVLEMQREGEPVYADLHVDGQVARMDVAMLGPGQKAPSGDHILSLLTWGAKVLPRGWLITISSLGGTAFDKFNARPILSD